MTRAFEGLRVVDLSDRHSGAFAARLFGDYGADVVLAEPPDGHPLRREPPFFDDTPGPDRGVLHAYLNWNKRSHVVRGGADIAALVATADVVVTNATDPGAGALGEGLRALRADAVHVSITAYGLSGPLAGRAGNNLTLCARSGWTYINGYKDEAPQQLARDQAGYVGGLAGFIAAAAALRRRDHGKGAERVDVSELEALALTVHPWAIAAIYDGAGRSLGPAGGRPRGSPGPLWDLADGRMHFAIADFHNWTEAMEVLKLPELGARKELIPDLGRHSQNLGEVAVAMTQTLPTLKRWDVFRALADLRCVVGVVQNIDDVHKNAQFAARRFFVDTRIEDRPVRAAGPLAAMTPCTWELSHPAPRIGQVRADSVAATAVKARTPARAAAAPAASALAAGPLAGVRVLSFGQAWSGTFGTEVLALLGADVVQVGSQHRPDVWRRVRDKVPKALVDASRRQHPLNTQGLYNSVNLNKREITLDLRKERGRELLWQLLPRFDILMDNFRPTVMPSWGITLEKLHAIRPGMIWASISGYGATGPYSQYPGNGSTTEPMSGLSSLQGYEGDHGMNTGGLFPDPLSGYVAAAAVMAALHHRDRTGEAQRIDLSMMEAVNVVCGDAVVEYDATGRLPGPRGNRHPRIAPHGNYKTRTDWLALAAETDAAWQALVGVIGDPRLRAERFETMPLRKANERELDAIIGDWCAQVDASSAEQQLAPLGVSVARVVSSYDLYSLPDPDFLASGFVSRVDHPEVGPSWLPGRPWRFSAAPSSPVFAAPCVGQHSREVLAAELGIDDAEYAKLVAAGVTGTLDDL